MPTLSVFFRKDDVEKWKAIEHKSEWLHNALSESDSVSKVPEKSHFVPATAISDLKQFTTISPERLQNGLCKEHGVPLDSRGKCLQRGCKYA